MNMIDKIILVGCGGTGSWLAPYIYRLIAHHTHPIDIVLADGDLVEEKNLARQNFLRCDLLQNKARTLAERCGIAFNREARYIPHYITDMQGLFNILTDHTFLISCVDNNASRKLFHSLFEKCHSLAYLDCGNGEWTGQVVLGIKRAGKTISKPVAHHYPDILESEDSFPDELGCADASLTAPQTMCANMMAANLAFNMVYQLLNEATLNIAHCTFSTKTLTVKPNILKRPLKTGVKHAS